MMIEELHYAGRPCEIIAWAKGDKKLLIGKDPMEEMVEDLRKLVDEIQRHRYGGN